jgi:murein endopeptidase
MLNNANYDKVGGTCNHHGPRNDNLHMNCRTPDNNHYGTALLLESIQSIADSFNTLYPVLSIRINDMSLPFGGGFDISANWDEDISNPNCLQLGHGHCTHRLGRNADISFRAINNNSSINLNSAQLRILFDIIENFYGSPHEHSDHYHLQ